MIDLHTHSSASDGTDSPADLVRRAADAGINILAITDHDTFAGWNEAADAAATASIDLMRGIEISTRHEGISIHLLGYLLDPDNPELRGELDKVRASREQRLHKMVQAMIDDGVPITHELVAQHITGDAPTMGRPHIADALVTAGVVTSRDAAFATHLSPTGPYYVSHYSIDVFDALRLVLAAGGVPVMAHPLAAKRGRVVDEQVIRDLAGAGLAGIEVHHHDHTPEQTHRAAQLAAELDLLPTGSSDYHGTGKVNVLAEHTTAPAVCREIVRAATGVPMLTNFAR